jgi:O-antigen ligase
MRVFEIFGQKTHHRQKSTMQPLYRKNLWNLIPAALYPPFLLVYGPWFYQVNSLKLALGLAAVIVLWVFVGLKLFKYAPSRKMECLYPCALLLLPTMTGIPGALLHGVPYNFPYELGTDLISVTWTLGILLIGGAGAFFAVQMSAGTVFVILGITVAGTSLGIWPELFPEEKLSFGNPNYGTAAVLLLLPTFTVFSIPRRIRGKTWKWSTGCKANALFTIASLFLLLHMGSRAGLMLGPALVTLLILAIVGRDYWPDLSPGLRVKVTILITACIAVIIAGLIYLYREEVLALTRLPSWEGRLMPWQAAWNSLKAAPFFGHGLGSSYGLFFQFLPDYYHLTNNSASYNHVHSEHLEILQETGIVGYVVIMGGIVLLAALLIRKWFKSPSRGIQGRLALALAVGIGIFYIHGSISLAQRMAIANLPFYLNLGMGIFLLSRGTFKPRPTTLPIVIGLFLIAGTAISLVPRLGEQYEHVQAVKTFNTQRSQAGYQELVGKLQDSSDVYALYETILMARGMKDSELGLRLARRLSTIMPNYRRVNYHLALYQAMEGLKAEALSTLEREPERTFGYMPALSLRAVLSAELKDFPTFENSCHWAIQQAILMPGEFGEMRKVRAKVVSNNSIQELVFINEEDNLLEINVNKNWIIRLYTHFSAEKNTSFDPEAFTLQLAAASKYGKLPLIDPASISREEVSQAYKDYLEDRDLGIRLREIGIQLLKTRSAGTAHRDRAEDLEKEIQSVEERREALKAQMADIVDLELLAKRQESVNLIAEFVKKMKETSKLVQATGPDRAKEVNPN